MNVTTSTLPVRHFVIDNFVSPKRDWFAPAEKWDGWEAHYCNDSEFKKRTTRAVFGWNADVLRQMQSLDVLRHCSQLFGVPAYPDALLWGGGLHVVAPNGWLNCHLDGVLHPRRPGLRRVVQLVCFCNYEWEPKWGGEFTFFDPDGEPLNSYLSLPGRLIAFESCHDLAYHGVLPVAADAPERVSVSASLLSDAKQTDTRRRALFLPNRLLRPPA